MARYRKIDTRIWNDARFREMSERGQLAFLFALTHPNMTMLGAMRATIPGLGAEYGHQISEKAFREAFQEGLSKGMAKHDEKASFFWFPNFLKYNKPESPNVVKTWPEAFDMLPECAMKAQLFQHLKGFIEGLSEAFQHAFREGFAEACAKAMPNQEQEQEQEQEKEKGGADAPLPSAFANDSPEEFMEAWNENCSELPKIIKLGPARKSKLLSRRKEGLSLEQFQRAAALCASTPFLRGENPRKWRADFNWLVENETNILKVLEGSYGAVITKRAPERHSPVIDSPHPSRVLSLDQIRAQAGIR